jgi:hypothetical protein
MGFDCRPGGIHSRDARVMAIHIPPIVSVDSMTLVWGLRSIGTDDQCRNATWLLQQFTTHKTQVIVSSVALSEYLTAFPPAQHASVKETLAKGFLFRSFSDECAPLAATLFQVGSQMRVKGEPGGRAILRADSLIIATARIHGAGCIYSNDANFLALANTIASGFGRDVPQPRPDLFGDPLPE